MSDHTRGVSALNPDGTGGRVFMLASANRDYEDLWPEYGNWETAGEAQKEADRLNAMTKSEFHDYSSDISNH